MSHHPPQKNRTSWGIRARPAAVISVAAVLLTASGAAEAHLYGAAGAGFAEGAFHPLGGLDHLLAMVAVGLWAAQIGGRALWLVPGSFVVMMAAGGLAAMAGAPLPAVELGIVGSLLVLGALVALAAKARLWVGAAVVGLLAVFHGPAHGTELAEAVSPALYALGFIATTALLHGVGLALGSFARAGFRLRLVRAGGAAIAATGLILLIAL